MTNPLADLRQLIAERCSLEEIQTWYFDLGLDWEELPSQHSRLRLPLLHNGSIETIMDSVAHHLGRVVQPLRQKLEVGFQFLVSARPKSVRFSRVISRFSHYPK